MKIFWTEFWALKPQANYLFHIEDRIYLCHFSFWHITIASYVRNLGGRYEHPND